MRSASELPHRPSISPSWLPSPRPGLGVCLMRKPLRPLFSGPRQDGSRPRVRHLNRPLHRDARQQLEDLRADLSLTAVDGFPAARLQGNRAAMVSEGVLGSSEPFHRLAAHMPALSRFGGWVADKGLKSAGAAALGTVVAVSVAAVAAKSGIDVSSLVPSGVSAIGAFVADIRGYDPGNV